MPGKNVEMAARQRNCLAKEVRRQMCSKITSRNIYLDQFVDVEHVFTR